VIYLVSKNYHDNTLKMNLSEFNVYSLIILYIYIKSLSFYQKAVGRQHATQLYDTMALIVTVHQSYVTVKTIDHKLSDF